jgi:hypothetical protein
MRIAAAMRGRRRRTFRTVRSNGDLPVAPRGNLEDVRLVAALPRRSRTETGSVVSIGDSLRSDATIDID